MTTRVLCVDDEPSVLSGLTRVLGRAYDLDTADGGTSGLAQMAAHGPYAVVISDMQMPGMNGVEFLREVRRLSPDTTRIMLTGNADQQTPQAAINESAIYRFLTKPCHPDALSQAVTDGLEHYQRSVAERELLEHTLHGAVKVLTEVLGLVNPVAFGRAMQLARCVRHMSTQLDLPDRWQYEMAAMLSQLGCLTVLPETLTAAQTGQPIPDEEQGRLKAQAQVARDLLGHIPRLEAVAEMVARQDERMGDARGQPVDGEHPVRTGVALLQVAKAFDRAMGRGSSPAQVRDRLASHPRLYHPDLVATLEDYQPEGPAKVLQTIDPKQLESGMVLADSLKTKGGLLLVHDGQEVTTALLARLEGFLRSGQLDQAVRVWVPRQQGATLIASRDQSLVAT